MIEISAAQLQTFADPHRAAFVARVRSFLESRLPQWVQGPAREVDRRIDAGLDEAVALGVASEQEQVLYLVLSMLHGAGFAEREPWAAAVVAERQAAGYQGGLAEALMDASPPAGAAA